MKPIILVLLVVVVLAGCTPKTAEQIQAETAQKQAQAEIDRVNSEIEHKQYLERQKQNAEIEANKRDSEIIVDGIQETAIGAGMVVGGLILLDYMFSE